MYTSQVLNRSLPAPGCTERQQAADTPQQSSLFPIFFEQDWLPDELMYSWASRYHRLSCSTRHRTTAKRLFGSDRFGYETDVPARIDSFVQAVSGRLGSAASVLLQHTPLPYYLLFRPQGDAETAITLVREGRLKEAKVWLQMPKNCSRHPTLRFCPACLEVDQKIHGTGYWHRAHQLPEVLLCPNHGLPLRRLRAIRPTDKRYQWQYQWLLPTHGASEIGFDASLLDDQRSKKILSTVASVSAAAVALSREFHFDSACLFHTYSCKLSARGFDASTKGAKEIAKAFLDAMRPVQAFHQVLGIAYKKESVATQVSRLLGLQPQGTTSLNLLFIAWLFDSWDEFARTYVELQDAEQIHPLFS